MNTNAMMATQKKIRMLIADLEQDMQGIASTGIIIPEEGGWFIPKFEARQSAIPDKERVAAMRDRKQKERYYADVTEPLRNVTQSREETEREGQRRPGFWGDEDE